MYVYLRPEESKAFLIRPSVWNPLVLAVLALVELSPTYAVLPAGSMTACRCRVGVRGLACWLAPIMAGLLGLAPW